MRPRVVAFAALCAAAALALLWLALRGGEETPPPRAERKPAIVARQVDPAPEIGSDPRAPEPAREPEPDPSASFSPDDAPVIEVLDILEAIARSTE